MMSLLHTTLLVLPLGLPLGVPLGVLGSHGLAVSQSTSAPTSDSPVVATSASGARPAGTPTRPRDPSAGTREDAPHRGSATAAESRPAPIDWRAAEENLLSNQLQLTFPDRYIKAGESYFSPDGTKVVFQAVEVAPGETVPEDFYAMFVADVVRDANGRITGLSNDRRLSPKGSANTCGWFHPTDPNLVIFGSTVSSPTEATPPGFQRGTGRYRWMFPPEMRIVQVDLRTADASPESLKTIVAHVGAYMAECSLSPDGRFLLYCSLESNQGDLFVHDLIKGVTTPLVTAPGYDGGPFFSPDGRRICWRSDRNGDNLLQLFVADLRFAPDADGGILGIAREHQLTSNPHVNWCPFWHPDGRSLVYGTSEVSHRNYEVFLLDADPGSIAPNTPASPGPMRYGTGARRITHADGADVLPAFTSDGRTMMWTSQRGEGGTSQLWVADVEWTRPAPPRAESAPR